MESSSKSRAQGAELNALSPLAADEFSGVELNDAALASLMGMNGW